MQLPRLVIISPCYNEELLIQNTVFILMKVIDDLIARSKIDSHSFVYFVNDGSTDSSWRLIGKLHAQDQRIKGVKLSRNFGYQSAHLAGLMQTRHLADCFVSIDSDLQDDPAVIERFIDAYQQGYEIVFGVKENSRRDAKYKRYGNKLFYLLMRLMGAPIINNHAEFRLAGKKAVDALSEYGEVNLFLRGMFRDLGFKSTEVSYTIRERTAGESKFTLAKLLSLALNGVTSFSIVPLRLIAAAGIIMLLSSLIILVLTLVNITGGMVVWLLVALLFTVGIQTMALGIVGEYIGKIYMETKARPRYIVEEELK